jgi:hypothetical protein
MEKIDARKLKIEAQQLIRNQVIRLRKSGKTYIDISEIVGIQASTACQFYKAYEIGGHNAMKIKKRGRPKGTGYHAGRYQRDIRISCDWISRKIQVQIATLKIDDSGGRHLTAVTVHHDLKCSAIHGEVAVQFKGTADIHDDGTVLDIIKAPPSVRIIQDQVVEWRTARRWATFRQG